MPVFYNFTQDGLVYSFDDVFIPADLFREGNLFTWGDNGSGSLGANFGINITRSTPITTFAGGTNWKQVVGGRDHVAAIKTDGTLWTWGYGFRGNLGNNTSGSGSERSTPVTTFAGGTNWRQVSADRRSTVAIKTDGTLWTWGYAPYGILGNGATSGTFPTPTTTFAGGTNWKQVSCGYQFAAAIKTDGTLWVWGRGVRSNIPHLGLNTDVANKSTPVTTFAGGNNWKQVSCGFNHTSAIKTDGTLWTWGSGGSGELGNNAQLQSSTPVTTFAGGTDWKEVSANRNFTTAIKTDGTLWVWGVASNGELGINSLSTKITPVTTFAGGNNWKSVSQGKFTRGSRAVKTDGTLWVWGDNNLGRLGTNDTINKSTPVTTFAGGTNWRQSSTGDGFTLALTYIDPTI